MILTDFALQTDMGDKLRTYIEPLTGMMVRDLATNEDWVVSFVNRSTRTMTLLRYREGEREEKREGVDYSKGGFLLTPGKNGEFEWTGVKAA